MKSYYTVDVSLAGYLVRWIDTAGNEHLSEEPSKSVPEAIKKFHEQRPAAQYIEWTTFQSRLERMKSDRAKMAMWNQAGKTSTEKETQV